MISRRFAREWCVVVLRNTWNTTSLINGTNFHKFTEKLLHQSTAQYFMVHPATTRKLHVTIEHLGKPTSTLNNHCPLNRPLVQTVPEFRGMLRQFHHAKSVEIISTCTASEWCVDDGAKHGLHDYPPLDQTSPQRSMERASQVHAPEFISQLCCIPKTPS